MSNVSDNLVAIFFILVFFGGGLVYPQFPVDVRDDLDTFLTIEAERTEQARKRRRELGR